MADNILVTPGVGATIAADDVGGVLHQRVKIMIGADGVANDLAVGAGAVNTGTPRVTLASDDPAVAALTASNTQLPSALGVQAAAASMSVTWSTENSARLPAALGAGTAAQGLKVVLPQDQAGTAQPTVTRPANTTAYSIGDVVGGAITFATGLTSGQHAMITGADLQYQITAIPSGMTSFRLHLYDVTPPSAIADNAAWTGTTAGDKTAYLGYIDLGSPALFGSGFCYCQIDNVNRKIKLNGSANLFGYLVTNTAYTPAANSEVILPRLHLVGV